MSTEIKTRFVEIPQAMSIHIEQGKITVKGPKGQVSRDFPRDIEIKTVDNKVQISAKMVNALTRALVGTFSAHIKNMFGGVQTPYIYKLKTCSTHFPMTATVSGSEFSVTNFLGEKRPRKVSIPQNVTVKVDGEIITVESLDIELAGKTATRIEQATRVSAKDRRVFQDGIYITEKAGKPVGG